MDWSWGRREAAFGDAVEGVTLPTEVFVAPRRIAVTGDGSLAVFITWDNDIGLVATDGSGVTFAELSGQVHSVAMSPDAAQFAVVLNDPFTGLPTKEIGLVNLSTNQEETINLVVPSQDGAPQDAVAFADALDFLPDGRTLIYDALVRIPTNAGFNLEGWALYGLDLGTKTIFDILSLGEGLDFGNPRVARNRPNLLTHEIVDRSTGISTVVAVDLSTGKLQTIGQLTQANVVGFPTYTGDGRAIIYTQVDFNANTTVSLFRQDLAEDGITPTGQPTLWLQDADFATVYRRGEFISENQLPQVTVASPSNRQVFDSPAAIPWSVSANDRDGSIAKVEFYVGSDLVAEDNSAPFEVTLNAETSTSLILSLTARAYDNIGGASDSAVIEIEVKSPTGAGGEPPVNNGTARPDIALKSRFLNGSLLQLAIEGGKIDDSFRVEASDDLVTWRNVSTLVKTTGQPVLFVDPEGKQRVRYYRVQTGR